MAGKDMLFEVMKIIADRPQLGEYKEITLFCRFFHHGKARLIFLSTSPEADAIWIIAIRMEYSLKTKEEAEKKPCRIKKAVKPSFTAFCNSNVREMPADHSTRLAPM